MQGNRVRKVTYKSATAFADRKYMGDYEVVKTEIDITHTHHITDDQGRFAMQEGDLIRFTHPDLLQSSRLETDTTGGIISFEEYHPFGTTSYQATLNTLTASAKRYRFAGKERDEESGLIYFGARYYAPWLCRFTSVDPKAGKLIPRWREVVPRAFIPAVALLRRRRITPPLPRGCTSWLPLPRGCTSWLLYQQLYCCAAGEVRHLNPKLPYCEHTI